ncbi:twin-arginine translocase TatA/TatE family subunit [Quadrisphaera oryzae]|uniref:twin-arginine translocase TatA/TatE family subunit n=1 Tax=Quadrisphaera TaxID=317661 RepID=UPI00164738F5|nr:twin-arginine translocase TatA/TatE family subunit [Quadrisphaera sp. RL12-1S]
MFGINPGEFAVLLVIALIVVGPERLPKYAAQLGRMVREGRKMAMGLREQVRGELGPEFDDVDWKKLDPRQYDPRKIIRDALTEAIEDDEPAAPPAPKPVSSGGPSAVGGAAAAAGAVGAAGAAGASSTSSFPPGAGLPSVSPADKRPSSADSPLDAAAVGTTGGPTAGGAAPANGSANGQANDAADGSSVPMARSAAGAPVDLEAT